MTGIENLRSRRKLSALLGSAPDGLPCRIDINRGVPVNDLLTPIASRLGYESSDGYRDTPFEDIAKRVNELFERRDIKSIETGGIEKEFYVTGKPVSRIVGPTLLARFMTKPWPSAPLNMSAATVRNDTRNDAREFVAAPAVPAAPPVRADVGTGHLALPLDGSQPAIVKRVAKSGAPPTFRFERTFQPESLAALKSARFDFHMPDTGERFEYAGTDLATYREARNRAFKSYSFCGVTARVDRNEIILLMADLAEHLHRHHDAGRVHGDLKPANILMTAGGVEAIDSLEMRPGIKSPAMTPGWAAPEQIIGDMVDYATDQYPLGLLLCTLLGGAMYGEEVNFIVPVGGSVTERFTLLRNPGVYLPPELVPIEGKEIAPWQRFLDRCLRFSPVERFGSMNDFSAGIRELCERNAIQGQLEMLPWFGNLEKEGEDGELAWHVQDTWD